MLETSLDIFIVLKLTYKSCFSHQKLIRESLVTDAITSCFSLDVLLLQMLKVTVLVASLLLLKCVRFPNEGSMDVTKSIHVDKYANALYGYVYSIHAHTRTTYN